MMECQECLLYLISVKTPNMKPKTLNEIISFAINAHQNTNHLYDGKPYAVHLSMVAMCALRHIDCLPHKDVVDVVLKSCWLHDTIEDCRLTYNDIKQVAGEEVANIVYAVTNEKGKTRKDRANEAYYKGIKETPWATFVKICDRIANVSYSAEAKSTMFDKYKQEHSHFLKSLFPNKNEMQLYKEMIDELETLIKLITNN